jgi:hypothetical protein
MSDSLREILETPDATLLMRERTLATRWGKSIRTLQRWRASGYGPPHILLGSSVRYRLGDVLAFETSMRRGGRNG